MASGSHRPELRSGTASRSVSGEEDIAIDMTTSEKVGPFNSVIHSFSALSHRHTFCIFEAL